MRIKLVNTNDIRSAISVDSISQSLFISGNVLDEKGVIAPVAKIQMTVEKARSEDFNRYASFFKNGDVSVIQVYADESDTLIATLHGVSVESVSQDIRDASSYIYISINA